MVFWCELRFYLKNQKELLLFSIYYEANRDIACTRLIFCLYLYFDYYIIIKTEVVMEFLIPVPSYVGFRSSRFGVILFYLPP